MSQQSGIGLDIFPAFLGTEKLFFSRSRLFVTGSLLSRLPGLIRRGTKLSMDKSAYNVHHMYPHSFSRASQINPACTPGLRNRNSGGASQVCQGYNVTVLTTTHWEEQLLSVLTANPWVTFTSLFIYVLSINLHLFYVLPAQGPPSVDLTAR